MEGRYEQVAQLVDAVGGSSPVCLDCDVDDADSGLVWDTSRGTAREVDGTKALACSRMRKSDPTGDIGRGLRQRAVISAVGLQGRERRHAVTPFQQDSLVDMTPGR